MSKRTIQAGMAIFLIALSVAGTGCTPRQAQVIVVTGDNNTVVNAGDNINYAESGTKETASGNTTDTTDTTSDTTRGKPSGSEDYEDCGPWVYIKANDTWEFHGWASQDVCQNGKLLDEVKNDGADLYFERSSAFEVEACTGALYRWQDGNWVLAHRWTACEGFEDNKFPPFEAGEYLFMTDSHEQAGFRARNLSE